MNTLRGALKSILFSNVKYKFTYITGKYYVNVKFYNYKHCIKFVVKECIRRITICI